MALPVQLNLVLSPAVIEALKLPSSSAEAPKQTETKREGKRDTSPPRVNEPEQLITQQQEQIVTAAPPPQTEHKHAVPVYAKGLYHLAEAMVGALGQGDVAAIWRWPSDLGDDDEDKLDWTRFIDPKFQDCIETALADLAIVSRASIWDVVNNAAARTQFMQYIKYEYSTTKLATKGTYRQLDAKSDLRDGFRRAADFFRRWRG